MPETVLRVRDLRKAYQDVVAVHGLDLEVQAGECFGLLGPNGAGKTTTIEICEGLTPRDSGELQVLGLRWESDAPALKQRLGIQLQETQLSEKLTVEETVRLFRSFFRKGPTAEHVIGLVQLEEKRRARVGTLSGGQKQRLALACALVGDPELLFLDEPTTGLDPQARRQLWELIEEFKRAGRTILLTTHYMDEAERLCERVAIMDHGKIIASGTHNELVQIVGEFDRIELTIDQESEKVMAAWRGTQGVEQVSAENGTLSLLVEDSNLILPRLFETASQADTRITSVQIFEPNLETVFLHLTGRALRD